MRQVCACNHPESSQPDGFLIFGTEYRTEAETRPHSHSNLLPDKVDLTGTGQAGVRCLFQELS